MISVLIVGNGNVATHLFEAFSKANHIIVSQSNSRELLQIPEVDVAIVAVSDDAIPKVSANIKSPLVVHTAGNVELNALKNTTRKGVFYPLQTFSKDKKVNLKEVPFCLEATQEDDLELLNTLAQAIGEKVYNIDSKQRKHLHLAAVFVNNFTNHLYKIGNDICELNNIPFSILHPLIQETASKIIELSPEKAQTGPAIRNDENTIKNHLEKLNQNQQEIYKLLTKSIQHGEKL